MSDSRIPVPPAYELTADQKKRLDNNFTYHPPHGLQAGKYEMMRVRVKGLAILFCEACPESRELSLALTKLEEAVFWVNAGIARNEKNPDDAP